MFLARNVLRTAQIARYFSTKSKKNVIVEQFDEILQITINRPDKRNAVNQQTSTELLVAIEMFETNESAKVAILRGSGGSFCAGYDLTDVAAGVIPDFKHVGHGPGPMGPTRMDVKKPVIAAIEGHAVAGGLELALWCDLRVADENAVMGVFCRRFGVPLIDGGTVRLPALIGLSRAMDLILTGMLENMYVIRCEARTDSLCNAVGRAVNAPDALSMGLVNRVAPSGQVLLIDSLYSPCLDV
jgi:enoyl-CoA hydratase